MGWFSDFVESAEREVNRFFGRVDAEADRAQDSIDAEAHRFENRIEREIVRDNRADINDIQPEGYQHSGQPTRHIINMDGTGQNDSDNTHSVIERLHNSIAGVGADGMAQHATYVDGSGSNGNLYNQASGADITHGMMHGYMAIAANYAPGDDIVMTGYSRGAIQAVSLEGFIQKFGIIDYSDMTQEEINAVTLDAFELYVDEDLTADSPEIVAFREQYSHEGAPPQITLGLIDGVDTRAQIGGNDYHDESVHDINGNVIHAVGLDENLQIFDPMRFQGQGENVNEMHFVGDHNTMGYTNSYETGLSAIPARWMAEQLSDVANVGFDPVAFESNFDAPDPLDRPGEGFGVGSDIGSDRHIPEGATIHASVAERLEGDPRYNPAPLNEHDNYSFSIEKGDTPPKMPIGDAVQYAQAAQSLSDGTFVRSFSDVAQISEENLALFTRELEQEPNLAKELSEVQQANADNDSYAAPSSAPTPV